MGLLLRAFQAASSGVEGISAIDHPIPQAAAERYALLLRDANLASRPDMRHLQFLGILKAGQGAKVSLCSLQDAIAFRRLAVSREQLQQCLAAVNPVDSTMPKMDKQENSHTSSDGSASQGRLQQPSAESETVPRAASPAQLPVLQAEDVPDSSNDPSPMLDATGSAFWGCVCTGVLNTILKSTDEALAVLREMDHVAVTNAELSTKFVASRHVCLKQLLAKVIPFPLVFST